MILNEKKTITINPELFKVNGGNNTTRRQKKESTSLQNKIQIREKKEKAPKKISTIKRNILKMIRNQQIEQKKKPEKDKDVPNESIKSNFQNDFNDTLEYLSVLTKDVEDKKKNETIRRYPSPIPSPPTPSMDVFEIPKNPEPIYLNTTPNAILLPPPKYGCLKNGNLPTYRNWMNQTRKSPPIQTIGQQIYEKKLEEKIKDLSRIQQQQKIESFTKHATPDIKHYKKPKQKRILRRTFYVGRSKVFPKISVLVANKTIRANTQLKTQNLKQIPISDVKNYLLKNGFIKVGTNAPNDVLREMYENTQMICGEIKDHNPDNLLYNYFNNTSEIL
jgi:hypothetical protein